MRIPVFALALTVWCIFPQASYAEDPTAPLSRSVAARPSFKSELTELLDRLGINFISRAHAAECTEEGETCTSNEQCCSGLECTGGPPTTCTPED